MEGRKSKTRCITLEENGQPKKFFLTAAEIEKLKGDPDSKFWVYGEKKWNVRMRKTEKRG